MASINDRDKSYQAMMLRVHGMDKKLEEEAKRMDDLMKNVESIQKYETELKHKPFFFIF